MEKQYDPHRLSSPLAPLMVMALFLVALSFLAAVLYRTIEQAFLANPGLNALILGVLAIGLLLSMGQTLGLMREAAWVNSFREGEHQSGWVGDPKLLAPMRALLDRPGEEGKVSISTASMRSILDSVAARLDEVRDISRYVIGLLVFLGLLGTFWGLLKTIGSIGDTIQALDLRSTDANDVLDALKDGLRSPLEGMGTAFSSSLFGLSGALALGFVDLLAGRAQNRFYTELENWLSSVADMERVSGKGDILRGDSLRDESLRIESHGSPSDSIPGARASVAMTNLAESIQELVQHIRFEQETLRVRMRHHEEQQSELLKLMRRLEELIKRAAKQ